MPAGLITANIHDNTIGIPVSGMRVQLYWVENHGEVLLRAAVTNTIGSTDTPLLDSHKMSAGAYKLVLHAGDYYASIHSPSRGFFDVLPVVFVVEDASVPVCVRVELSLDRYTVRMM